MTDAVAHGTHISFHPLPIPEGRKTVPWEVRARAGRELLGTIKWYPGWRAYAFFPLSATIWEQQCLREVAAFISVKTCEQKHKPFARIERTNTRTFTNEFGNEIKMDMQGGACTGMGSPRNSEKLFYRIQGPRSEVMHEVTIMEAKQLHDMLGEMLSHVTPFENDATRAGNGPDQD